MWQYLWNHLWERDPDFFRLKHAFRTIIAIIVATLLLSRTNLMMQLYAGIAAGFSIQRIVTHSKKETLQFLILADVFYYLSFTLGVLVKPYPLAASLTLIILAFFALYVRRFGDRFMFFPIFIWTFCFFGLYFPSESLEIYFRNSLGLIVGFVVAAFCYIFLFPEHPYELFYKNTEKFFSSYSMSLKWLKNSLRKEISLSDFSHHIGKYKWHDFNLVLANQTILESVSNKKSDKVKILSDLYISEFAMMKTLSMLIEAFEKKIRENVDFSRTALLRIHRLFHAFINLLASTNNQQLIDKAEEELKLFKNYLSQSQLVNNKKIVILLNINLAFQLLFKNLLVWNFKRNDQTER